MAHVTHMVWIEVWVITVTGAQQSLDMKKPPEWEIKFMNLKEVPVQVPSYKCLTLYTMHTTFDDFPSNANDMFWDLCIYQ